MLTFHECLSFVLRDKHRAVLTDLNGACDQLAGTGLSKSFKLLCLLSSVQQLSWTVW